MTEPKLVSTWEELKDCESNSHLIEVDLRYGNGWVRPKYKTRRTL